MPFSRIFLVNFYTVRTDGRFPLTNLTQGRLDVLCRVVRDTLLTSNGIRQDTTLLAVLNGPPKPPKQLEFRGSEIKRLHPDERSIAGLIRSTLKGKKNSGIHCWEQRSLKESLELTRSSKLFYLQETGEDIHNVLTNYLHDKCIFVLGDHLGLKKEDEQLLESYNPVTISIGPISLLSSQCITLIHNEIDRREVEK
ncbi:MAG: tRNA (pseudouridine(54)-N(1))-methyltransferase TrmY [Promethearchaeota archaeon]